MFELVLKRGKHAIPLGDRERLLVIINKLCNRTPEEAAREPETITYIYNNGNTELTIKTNFFNKGCLTIKKHDGDRRLSSAHESLKRLGLILKPTTTTEPLIFHKTSDPNIYLAQGESHLLNRQALESTGKNYTIKELDYTLYIKAIEIIGPLDTPASKSSKSTFLVDGKHFYQSMSLRYKNNDDASDSLKQELSQHLTLPGVYNLNLKEFKKRVKLNLGVDCFNKKYSLQVAKVELEYAEREFNHYFIQLSEIETSKILYWSIIAKLINL
jgi:hypothetical protein